MGEALLRRLKQSKFQSVEQEAMLNLFVASGFLESKIDRFCADFGISHQQYNILRILRGAHPRGRTCGEIGERMLDRAPDVTRRLDALERHGLVERDRSPDDRRVVMTKITEKGSRLLDQMGPGLEEISAFIRTRLSEEECAELSRICELLYDVESCDSDCGE